MNIFKSKQHKRIDEWVKDFKQQLEFRVKKYGDVDVAARKLYIEAAQSYGGKV